METFNEHMYFWRLVLCVSMLLFGSVAPSILPNTTARTTVNEGETLDLSCVPSNPNVPDAEIQVQWFFDGVEIIEDERFELSPAGLNHR